MHPLALIVIILRANSDALLFMLSHAVCNIHIHFKINYIFKKLLSHWKHHKLHTEIAVVPLYRVLCTVF